MTRDENLEGRRQLVCLGLLLLGIALGLAAVVGLVIAVAPPKDCGVSCDGITHRTHLAYLSVTGGLLSWAAVVLSSRLRAHWQQD